MSSGVTKAVVPVAGLGTRFLPATKATPKEMLPVVDKPAIQYVVEEAVRAGLADLLFVTGRNKSPLEDHFDRNYELEDKLSRDDGKQHLLDAGAGVDRAGDRPLRAAGRGTRSRPCRADERAPRRQRAVRRAARRRPDRRTGRAPDPDDRRAAATRWLRRCPAGGAARPDRAVRLRGGRGRPTRTTWCASPAWSRSRTLPRRRATLAIIGRYVLAPRDLRRAARHPARPRR